MLETNHEIRTGNLVGDADNLGQHGSVKVLPEQCKLLPGAIQFGSKLRCNHPFYNPNLLNLKVGSVRYDSPMTFRSKYSFISSAASHIAFMMSMTVSLRRSNFAWSLTSAKHAKSLRISTARPRRSSLNVFSFCNS
jgi:hypothetical protein